MIVVADQHHRFISINITYILSPVTRVVTTVANCLSKPGILFEHLAETILGKCAIIESGRRKSLLQGLRPNEPVTV